jgi:3-hydroxybutyryl-CoA dehydrogenase
MSYQIICGGESRSFPEHHSFIENASETADAQVYLGAAAGRRFTSEGKTFADAKFVAIELGDECLGAYLGDQSTAKAGQTAATNVFGFARFRLGRAEPTALVELVTLAEYDKEALAAAKAVFEAAGLVVAVCGDFPGRIVNRLVRPYYNAVLRRVDEKLATAADLDTTLRLGLGYPVGPVELLQRTGLDEHFLVTQALYEALGDPAYAPARLARNAHLSRQVD